MATIAEIDAWQRSLLVNDTPLADLEARVIRLEAARVTGSLIGTAAVTANQAGIGVTVTDLTSLTVPFTATTSHKYLVLGIARFTQNTSAGIVQMQIADGSNVQLYETVFNSNVSESKTLFVMSLWTPGSGSVTAKLRANTNANTMDLVASATNPATIAVFDAGTG